MVAPLGLATLGKLIIKFPTQFITLVVGTMVAGFSAISRVLNPPQPALTSSMGPWLWVVVALVVLIILLIKR